MSTVFVFAYVVIAVITFCVTAITLRLTVQEFNKTHDGICEDTLFLVAFLSGIVAAFWIVMVPLVVGLGALCTSVKGLFVLADKLQPYVDAARNSVKEVKNKTRE